MGITVLGSITMDTVTVMERFPEAGETVIGNSVNNFFGGKGANQCIAVRRLGCAVTMLGKVGSDENGSAFFDLFSTEGIVCDEVKTAPEASTGNALIEIDKNGQNRICVVPGANYCINIDDLKSWEKTIINSKLLIMQLEIPIQAVKRAIDICTDNGVAILLNPAPAIKLGASYLRKVSYLTPNEHELGILSGMPINTAAQIEDAARHLLSEGVRCLVVTLGKDGALIADNKGIRHIKGYLVKAIDTVAAGDSFNGALAVKLLQGDNIDEAVRYANAMGALTVTKRGAIPSIHNKEQLEAFIKNYH